MKKPNSAYFYLIPAGFFFTVFTLYPIINNLYITFFDWTGISPTKQFIGFSNYIKMFNDGIFWVSLKNNIIYVLVTLITEVFAGLALAMLLNIKLKGSSILRMVYFSPSMLSMVIVGILWSFMLNPYFGIVNCVLTVMGLGSLTRNWLGNSSIALYAVLAVSLWRWIGFNMLIFYAGLQRIPESLYEAARIDGASTWTCFWCITIPLMREMITVVSTYAIIGGLNMFDLFWVMTRGGPHHATELMATWAVRVAFTFNRMSYGATLIEVMFMLTMVTTVIYLTLRRKAEVIEY